MIRAIFTLSELVVFSILSIPVLAVLLIVRLFSPKTSGAIAQAIMRVETRILLWCAGSKLRVRGTENIPGDETLLFVSNHRGLFDIVAAFAATPVDFGFIAKKELRWIPSVSWYLYMCNGLFLDRSDMKKSLQTINDAVEKAKNGMSYWIFPEGTRSKGATDREMEPFKEGSFHIAKKAKIAVLPVAIAGTRDMVENKRCPGILPTVVTVSFGKPVRLEELDPEDRKHLAPYTQQRILELLPE